MSKGTILSGMRPTGSLHIGHLVGVLNNWITLQSEYDCFFMVADIHALTTEYENPNELSKNTIEIVRDWISCGIAPGISVVFRQSDMPQHSELHLYLSMITPLGWLSRCPTYKEQIKELKDRELHTYGFLGYPLLQAADILLYKATAVPVGEDQLPHIEMTREIARRFNSLYKKIFPEPKSLITEVPKVPGTDGRKMSKSYNNTILLSDEKNVLEQKIRSMFTDPLKIKVDDLGHPEGCVVFSFHKMFNPDCRKREDECKRGKIGCVACKKALLEYLESKLNPIREKRKQIDDKKITELLDIGATKARKIANQTISEVKKVLGVS